MTEQGLDPHDSTAQRLRMTIFVVGSGMINADEILTTSLRSAQDDVNSRNDG